MKITKIQEPHYPNQVRDLIEAAFRDTRFALDITSQRNSVIIHKVRCRTKKAYCGNHPKACERPHHGPHPKRDFLEGADWVEFNDRLNDVLDDNNVDARVESSVCIIRKGLLRRIWYRADQRAGNGTWIWNKDEPNYHWEDGAAMRAEDPERNRRSLFPEGTPGIYNYNGVEYNCVG